MNIFLSTGLMQSPLAYIFEKKEITPLLVWLLSPSGFRFVRTKFHLDVSAMAVMNPIGIEILLVHSSPSK